MSLLPSLSARVPRLALPLLLLLLLLTPPRPLADAGPIAAVVRELRCVCLTTTKVHPKMISNLQVTAAGPQCSKVEVIASLKNGEEVCLDPEAPLIKRVIQRILDSSGNKKN